MHDGYTRQMNGKAEGNFSLNFFLQNWGHINEEMERKKYFLTAEKRSARTDGLKREGHLACHVLRL